MQLLSPHWQQLKPRSSVLACSRLQGQLIGAVVDELTHVSVYVQAGLSETPGQRWTTTFVLQRPHNSDLFTIDECRATGLTVWNTLPEDMWDPKLVAHSFRQSLKTFIKFCGTSVFSTLDIGYKNVLYKFSFVVCFSYCS